MEGQELSIGRNKMYEGETCTLGHRHTRLTCSVVQSDLVNLLGHFEAQGALDKLALSPEQFVDKGCNIFYRFLIDRPIIGISVQTQCKATDNFTIVAPINGWKREKSLEEGYVLPSYAN